MLIFSSFVTCMRCGRDVSPLIGATATSTNEAFFGNGRKCHPTRIVHRKNGRFSITDYVFFMWSRLKSYDPISLKPHAGGPQMTASYMSINRVDVQQAVKEVARFMAEPNEGAWIMLKRLVRYFMGHGRLVQVISEQRYVKAPAWILTGTPPDACLPEHDVCSSLQWRQSDQSRELDARRAKFE